MLLYLNGKRKLLLDTLMFVLLRMKPSTEKEMKALYLGLQEIFGLAQVGRVSEVEVEEKKLREQVLKEWTDRPAFKVSRERTLNEMMDKEMRRKANLSGINSVRSAYERLGLGPSSRMGVA